MNKHLLFLFKVKRLWRPVNEVGNEQGNLRKDRHDDQSQNLQQDEEDNGHLDIPDVDPRRGDSFQIEEVIAEGGRYVGHLQFFITYVYKLLLPYT